MREELYFELKIIKGISRFLLDIKKSLYLGVFFDKACTFSFGIVTSVTLLKLRVIKMEEQMILKNIIAIFMVAVTALLGRSGDKFPKLWEDGILKQEISQLRIGVVHGGVRFPPAPPHLK